MARLLFYTTFLVCFMMLLLLAGSSITNPELSSQFGITYTPCVGSDDPCGFGWDGSDFFWDSVFVLSIAGGVSLGGLFVGWLTQSPSENYLVAGVLSTVFGAYVKTMASWIPEIMVWNGAEWLGISISMILILIGLGYLVTLFDYFRGSV